MYTTFVGVDKDQTRQRNSAAAAARPRKPKRQQVSRACEPCRTNRAKCSTTRPCASCLDRGCECYDGPSRSRNSVTSAGEDVDELWARFYDLERRLKECQGSTSSDTQPSPNSNSRSSPSAPTAASAVPNNGIRPTSSSNHTSASHATQSGHSRRTSTGRSEPHLTSTTSSTFGPASFSSAFGLLDPSFDSSTDNEIDAIKSFQTERLSKSSQLYYLGVFWNSLHCTLPILCERDIEAHFRSLWPDNASSSLAQARRKPSAIVDIVVACAMQYNMQSRSQIGADSGGFGATPAIQRWYFERSQSLIFGNRLNSPDLECVQSLILLGHYLANDSLVQKACGFYAMAARFGVMLGLHQEPPSNIRPTVQELRRRIWWTLHTIESFNALNGWPWSLSIADVQIRPMADDLETAIVSCSAHASADGTGTTWLTYSAQMAQLYRLAIDGLNARRQCSPSHANTEPILATLAKWADSVPLNMRTIGVFGNGEEASPVSYNYTPHASTTRAYRLRIDNYKPQWLQRQRLLLELHFRHIIMLFSRYAIEVRLSTPDRGSNNATIHGSKCVEHAVCISRILHQVLSETELLCSHIEVQHMLWNASLAIAVSLMTIDHSPSKSSLVDTLRLNYELLKQLSNQRGVASRASAQLLDLLQKMGISVPQIPTNPPSPQLPKTTVQMQNHSWPNKNMPPANTGMMRPAAASSMDATVPAALQSNSTGSLSYGNGGFSRAMSMDTPAPPLVSSAFESTETMTLPFSMPTSMMSAVNMQDSHTHPDFYPVHDAQPDFEIDASLFDMGPTTMSDAGAISLP